MPWLQRIYSFFKTKYKLLIANDLPEKKYVLNSPSRSGLSMKTAASIRGRLQSVSGGLGVRVGLGCGGVCTGGFPPGGPVNKTKK